MYVVYLRGFSLLEKNDSLFNAYIVQVYYQMQAVIIDFLLITACLRYFAIFKLLDVSVC